MYILKFMLVYYIVRIKKDREMEYEHKCGAKNFRQVNFTNEKLPVAVSHLNYYIHVMYKSSIGERISFFFVSPNVR